MTVQRDGGAGIRGGERRWARRHAAAALIAGVAAAGTAHGAIGGFDPGAVTTGTFDATLEPAFDLDGDGQFDFQFALGSEGLGIDIFPLENNGISNRVFQGLFGQAIRFFDPSEIAATDPEAATSDVTYLDFDFSYGGYIGFVFDIPGGSPYFGYLEIESGATADSFTVLGSGFTPVPEPASVAVLGLGAALVAPRRRRRA
jgi:hypothetical protein